MLNLESYSFSLYAIPNIIVSTLIFAIGLFVFIQNKKSPSHITFFLFCLSLNFWLYGRALMYCSKTAENALWIARSFAFFGVSFIAPLVFAFSSIWLNRYSKQKILVIFGFLTAPILYLLTLLTPYGIPAVREYFWGYYPVYGISNFVFLAIFFFYFVSAFINFFSSFKKTKEPIARKQLQLVTFAFLISFTGSIDYLPKVVNIGLYPFGFLSVFIWTIVMGYSIVRYKTLDISTAIHKTIMWFSSTVVAILPFAVLVYATENWASGHSTTITTVFYLTLLIGFYFYFRAIQPRLDHVFQRRRANLQSVMNKFSEELVHLKELRDLLQGFVRMIRKTLYTTKISVYLRDQSDQQLVPSIVKRLRGLKPFSLDNPFLRWLEKRDTVIIADLAQGDPEVQLFRDELLNYFSKVQADVAVPLVLGGRLIGVVNLGQKVNYRKYTHEEIQFLSQLRLSITIAFANSLQYIAMQKNLQKWNEELEKKVDERTNQLQSTQAQLVQAEKLATIGTLAGGVAHEINNPLTAVLTNAQILKMTANSDDIESVSLIEEGAKRCQAIIKKLMKYSRKPSDPEVMEKVSIQKVVDNTISFLNYQLKQENIELVLHDSKDISDIMGNAIELEQVITNLIINAKDAVKKENHQGRIEIQTLEQNGSVSIIVRDNGHGISKENLPRIFDPFFTTKEVGKGTGLGLAVTFGIIRKHKGKVEVTSEVGKGTTFCVQLPKESS